MARFEVVIRTDDGHPAMVLDETRRFNGAVNILNKHVESKRAQLERHAEDDEPVLNEPVEPVDTEVYAEAVSLVMDDTCNTTVYAIRKKDTTA